MPASSLYRRLCWTISSSLVLSRPWHTPRTRQQAGRGYLSVADCTVPLLQEGAESQGSFMASLMADMEHGGSLMPSDSAFRIASLAPQHQPHLQQGQDGSSDDLGFTSPPAAAYQHAAPVPFLH